LAGGRLPTLRRREVEKFFDHFATSWRWSGNNIVGVGRKGSFSVHPAHNGELPPQLLRKALGYLGVTSAEFIAWYDSI